MSVTVREALSLARMSGSFSMLTEHAAWVVVFEEALETLVA
jgi:hypothetical protein